jgi:hypothetical protein
MSLLFFCCALFALAAGASRFNRALIDTRLKSADAESMESDPHIPITIKYLLKDGHLDTATSKSGDNYSDI